MAYTPPPVLGGWLFLVMIGIVVSPIRLLVLIVNDLLPIFNAETWSVLTTPGSDAYHPLWAPLLIFELGGNFIFFGLSVGVAVFFFMRRAFLPKLFIVYMVLNLMFIVLDYILAGFIPFLADSDKTESVVELIRTVIACSIWVPYFLVSKRVKSTFVL